MIASHERRQIFRFPFPGILSCQFSGLTGCHVSRKAVTTTPETRSRLMMMEFAEFACLPCLVEPHRDMKSGPIEKAIVISQTMAAKIPGQASHGSTCVVTALGPRAGIGGDGGHDGGPKRNIGG